MTKCVGGLVAFFLYNVFFWVEMFAACPTAICAIVHFYLYNVFFLVEMLAACPTAICAIVAFLSL